jgi:lipopolysaccharide export system protein LptA
MMIHLTFLCLITTLLLASVQKINIQALNFEADQTQYRSIFTNNVKITKGSDQIKADKVTIYFDRYNKPISYEAVGSVTFELKTKESTINGECEKLLYNPKNQTYTLVERVNINDYISKRKIIASKVIIDQINGKVVIHGEKKSPVKFIFTTED